MTDLFTYPAICGYKDRDTSRAAAVAMQPRSHILRVRCLEAIRASHSGLTSDECAARLGVSILATRPRLSELLATGQIVDTGTRRPNQSGKSAKVYTIAGTPMKMAA